MLEEILEAIKKPCRVFLIGNGGSAANAIHIANDLIAKNVKAQALTADVATLTAIANDFGYEHVFSRQLSVLAEKGDVLIALSGSGKSKNIVQAMKIAEKIGMKTFLITNYLKEKDMQDSEEEQVNLGHELWRRL